MGVWYTVCPSWVLRARTRRINWTMTIGRRHEAATYTFEPVMFISVWTKLIRVYSRSRKVPAPRIPHRKPFFGFWSLQMPPLCFDSSCFHRFIFMTVPSVLFRTQTQRPDLGVSGLSVWLRSCLALRVSCLLVWQGRTI